MCVVPIIPAVSSRPMQPHGIMFHHFHDRRHPRGQGAISRDDLRRLIDYVGQDRILPAREWMRRASKGTLRDSDVCLTFDDNLRCQYDVAVPVLREFGLTAFWFVYTSVLRGNVETLEIYRYFRTTEFTDIDKFYCAFFQALDESPYAEQAERSLATFDPKQYLKEFTFYSDNDRRFRFARDRVLGPASYADVMDRMIVKAGVDVARMRAELWMDNDAVREVHAGGHVIGLHSDTHPTQIGELPFEQQQLEYQTNHAYLTQLLGDPPLAASHPCNSYSAATLEILRDLGIQLAFRANMSTSAGSMLEWPREDHANLCKRMAA